MADVAYPYRAVIVSPIALAAMSAQVAQALGPDSAEYLSFGSIKAIKDGVEYQVCDTPITLQTRSAYQAMLADSSLLHAAVVAGWRRKDMDPPPLTEEECSAWLAASTIWLGDAWSRTGFGAREVLDDMGLEYVPIELDMP